MSYVALILQGQSLLVFVGRQGTETGALCVEGVLNPNPQQETGLGVHRGVQREGEESQQVALSAVHTGQLVSGVTSNCSLRLLLYAG